MTLRPLITGDVLPAIQLATDHAHETGWEAVRFSRPNMRPWTRVQLPIRAQAWHEVVVFSRVTNGRESYRSVDCDVLMLIRRGSDPTLFDGNADF